MYASLNACLHISSLLVLSANVREVVLDIPSTYAASQPNTNLQPLLPHTIFSYHPSFIAPCDLFITAFYS